MFDYTTIVKDHFATNSPDPLSLIIMHGLRWHQKVLFDSVLETAVR